ncbi:hypothetical protein H6A12_04400 [Phocea massiliensis]|uniref:Uroporphyrinogen decarboxylase (URO-D) domain-containing protein n=1 Tax=Merdimmobilis hominis TaxID=2897707 RepID=A0A939BE04_9FIRM|nr:hypothetical protein [Merdimmobilis hominis]MBM6920396.1 hypothetical protein [Merdimmobilis hominis]
MNREEILLRTLAWEYACAANNEKNMQARTLHTAVNDLKMIRPVVLIEEIPFHELNFHGSLTLLCEDPDLHGAEDWFRRQLFKWKHFPADMILPPYFPVQKIMHSTGIGITVEEHTIATEAENHIISHEYFDQLAEPEDLEKLTPPVISYDKEETMRRYEKLANVFGDILPVRVVGHSSYITMWDEIARYRGVTPLLMDLIERPEHSHAIVSKLAEFEKSKSAQMEALGLFEIQPLEIHCTSALTSDLPGEYDGGIVKRSQVWGRGMAQIFGSVSKDMHEEFDIDYMKEIMEPFGLVYYGCCEPLDKKVDIVEKIPHLRKISITPWADVDNAAEVIGKRYAIANKPNPALVATATLDEDAVRQTIKRTLDACKRNGCSADIVLKDISTVSHNVQNLIRFEQIAMELVRGY